jgi:hypothetical protein
MSSLMMRNRFLLLISLCILALTMLLVGLSSSVTAQGDIKPQTATPLPSPTNNGGSATWTISATTFQSHFPKGFEFGLDASSSAGKIVQATVFWLHAPGYVHRAGGKIDSAGKITAAWVPGLSDSVPQWAGVEYWWQLKDEAGNLF